MTEPKLPLLQKPRGRWAPALTKAGSRMGRQHLMGGDPSDRQVQMAGRLLRAITRVTFYFQDEENVVAQVLSAG